ncbi:unnamed protein product [Symbiodinium sp. CCMP2592]|nr:unnamed protein product [Symbiodinium sp. CCMP2592]
MALSLTRSAELLTLQLLRAGPEGKDHTSVSMERFVMLPHFTPEYAVQWYRFKVQAIVEHHGEQITSGHYRSVLRVDVNEWLHTNDGQPAERICWSPERGSLAYLIWLTPVGDSSSSPEERPRLVQDGEQEWNFYRNFWPSGQPVPSDSSTAVTDPKPEERETKAARHGVSKGQGKKPPAAEAAPHSGEAAGDAGHGSLSSVKSQGTERKREHLGGGGGGETWGGAATGPPQAGGGGGGGGGGGNGAMREIRDLQYSLGLVQRLVLRLEDCAILARIESSFVINFKLNVPASVVPMLFTAAGSWRKQKTEEPATLDRPMRCALFAELKDRVLKIVEQTDKMQEMEAMGWVSGGMPITWHFMRWDPESQRQIADTERPPLTQLELLEAIDGILALIPRQFVVARFHPTRKLTQEMHGTNLVFLLQTGQHGVWASELRDTLKRLCHNAVFHLMAAALKADKQSRSALANAVAACIQ